VCTTQHKTSTTIYENVVEIKLLNSKNSPLTKTLCKIYKQKSSISLQKKRTTEKCYTHKTQFEIPTSCLSFQKLHLQIEEMKNHSSQNSRNELRS